MQWNRTTNYPNFFKQFTGKEEFNSFFSGLCKQGVEQMLQAGLDNHLGYEKHAKEGNNSGNSRNGTYPKRVKTQSLGNMVLNIPRDCNSEFEPQLIPKGQRTSYKLEGAIIGMYSPGHDNFRYCRTGKQAYGIEVSEGTISTMLLMVSIEHVKQNGSNGHWKRCIIPPG